MEHKTIEEALLAAQQEMPNLVKDSKNPHFKSSYISLHGLLGEVLPVFQKHGILFAQFPDTSHSGQPALTTILSLPIENECYTFTTPLWAAKEDAQGQGGAITYMRRYALMSALGLVAEDEDDDGNKASGKPAARRPQPTAQQIAGDEAHSPGKDSVVL